MLKVYIEIFNILRMYFNQRHDVGTSANYFQRCWLNNSYSHHEFQIMSLLCTVLHTIICTFPIGSIASFIPFRCFSYFRLIRCTLFITYRTSSSFLFLQSVLPIFVQLFFIYFIMSFQVPFPSFSYSAVPKFSMFFRSKLKLY